MALETLRNLFSKFKGESQKREYSSNIDREYSDYFKDEDCPYAITPKMAEEIASKRSYKDYVKKCKERYTGFWVTDAAMDVVDIEDRKCYLYQVKEADIAWRKNGDSYDGIVSPEGLKYLRCLVDVNTGDYKYYPDK